MLLFVFLFCSSSTIDSALDTSVLLSQGVEVVDGGVGVEVVEGEWKWWMWAGSGGRGGRVVEEEE